MPKKIIKHQAGGPSSVITKEPTNKRSALTKYKLINILKALFFELKRSFLSWGDEEKKNN